MVCQVRFLTSFGMTLVARYLGRSMAAGFARGHTSPPQNNICNSERSEESRVVGLKPVYLNPIPPLESRGY